MGRTQQRGPITDYYGKGPDGTALCVCAHGKEWAEGDPEGVACVECCEAWRTSPEHAALTARIERASRDYRARSGLPAEA